MGGGQVFGFQWSSDCTESGQLLINSALSDIVSLLGRTLGSEEFLRETNP